MVLPPPPPRRRRTRTPQPRRAETVHSAGGVGSTLKTTDAALVIYLADAWAARAVLGGRRKLEVTPWTTVRETKALVAKLLEDSSATTALVLAVHRVSRCQDVGGIRRPQVWRDVIIRRFPPSYCEFSNSRTGVVRRHPRGRRRLPPPLGKALLKARRGQSSADASPN